MTYWPYKYHAGLSKSKNKTRKAEAKKFGAKHWKDPAAYTGFKTDRGIKTRKSSYSANWERRFPGVKSLEDRAAATGVPVRFLRESYNRGMAAWRTGHRPGATEQQWGWARVSSFLLCGKTHYTTDADLVKKAVAASKTAAAWFKQC